MTLPRIYHPAPITPPTVILTERAAHHVVTVLRKKVHDPLVIFSEGTQEWDAHIVAIERKQVRVALDQARATHRESPLKIHLAVALCKGDKLDWIIQKAVELGVTAITPLSSVRSLHLSAQQLTKKHQHWQGVLISAVEQCGRTHLPRLEAPLPLHTFLQQPVIGTGWILHPEAPHTLSHYAAPTPLACTLLIGPEGGWHEDEYQQALAHHYHPLCLGPRILRAETAPLALMAVLQAQWGDFTEVLHGKTITH